MQLPESLITLEEFPPRIDPRIYAFGKFAAKEPTKHADMLATAATAANIDNKKVTFSAPSHAALCLNISHTAYSQILDAPIDHVINCTHPRQADLTLLYNWFEQTFINVVFAHIALEAFTNQRIPDDFVFSRTRQDKKATESFTKDQIERHLSLDVKLSEVLPEITGILLKKGSSLWNDYTKIRKIRDRIVHVKSADLGIKNPKTTSIWADLLEYRNTDFSLIAHKVIEHFPEEHDQSSSPVASGRNLWIKHFPKRFSKPTMITNKINDRTLVSVHNLLLRFDEIASLEIILGNTKYCVRLQLKNSDDPIVKWEINHDEKGPFLTISNTKVGSSAISEKDIEIAKSSTGDILLGQFSVQHFTGDLTAVMIQFTIMNKK